MRRAWLGSILAAVLAAAACGGGDLAQCTTDYGFTVDGASCDTSGDSHAQCDEVSCTCSGSVSLSVYICAEGTCVTGIKNCDAWCAATAEQRASCM
jgi:hypothetical protein